MRLSQLPIGVAMPDLLDSLAANVADRMIPLPIKFAEAHVTETTKLLRRVQLDQEDRVYFYVFDLRPATYHAQRCRAQGLVALGEEETRVQFDMLKELCAKHYGEAVPKICLFDSVESIY